MMASNLDVHLYSGSLVPETNSLLQIVEADASGVKMDFQTNGHLGNGIYGARLTAPGAPTSVSIWVHDTRAHYAPASLCYLHGGATSDLHVALYPIPQGGSGAGSGSGPSGGGGGGPRPLDSLPEVFAYIDQKASEGHWQDDEAEGVRRLLDAVINALGLTRRGSELQRFLDEWQHTLHQLGIAIAQAARVHGGGAPQG